MHPRSIGRVAAIVLATGLAWTSRAGARGDAALPPELMDAARYPGMHAILQLNGESVHNCGNVLLHLTNFGWIGSAPGSRLPFDNAPSAQWPAGSQTEYLFLAGLWIGAVKAAEPHVSTTYTPNQARGGLEFRPGLGELDIMYRTHEGAVGGARKPSPNADDDRDGKTDEDWLDGRDNDGDGRIDEDFAAISNQMFFCEYGDTDPNIKLAQPEHVPLGLHVQQASYCWEDPLIDDFIAFDYKLINQGVEPLQDVYIGIFADCDIGLRTNDNAPADDWAGFCEELRTARIGTDTKTVKISIGYMFDDDTDEGQSEGYIGVMFLGAQDPGAKATGGTISLRNFRISSGTASYEQGGDPTNDEQRYQMLAGTAPRSLPPADPVTDLHPCQLARRADEYRILVSAGPFGRRQQGVGFTTVDPGDTLAFQAALVLGRFYDGMMENAVQAQLTYDGVYLDCDGDPLTGKDGRETPVCGPALAGQQFPVGGSVDPVSGRVTWCPAYADCDGQPRSNNQCWATVPQDACVYINADCEIEAQTGFKTGVDGKECLIHWLVSSAPPPPRMRLIARENQVDILWDNFSEVTPDLRLGILDFESYRIWRADNWTRPFGTDVNTGPGAGLWMLLAEYDLPRNGIGADTGLESIRYSPNIPDRAVEFYREWFAAHPFLQPPDLPGFTPDQLDTAKAMAKGARYYRYTDPPFKKTGCVGNPNDPADCVTVRCPAEGKCPPVQTAKGPVLTRCNAQGMCQETSPPPHSGAHYFYSITATDHKAEIGPSGELEPVGPGLAGEPSSNFVYINPPSSALAPEHFDQAAAQIYVVPNPATPQSLKDWQLMPNNDDPTGVKVEFHHLPKAHGKVTVYTLSGDMVVELPFDNTDGTDSLPWNLLSRNGQEVTSGVYLFSVEADHPDWNRFIGRFVVIR